MNSVDRVPEDKRIGAYEELAQFALTEYGIESAELTFLGDTSNVMFEVGVSAPHPQAGRYALRICRAERARDGLLCEQHWLHALRRDTELCVPEPICGLDGSVLREVRTDSLPKPRLCMLFRWVEGEFIDADLTPDHLRAVGRFMAKLHNHAEGFAWPTELRPTRQDVASLPGLLAGLEAVERYSPEALALLGRGLDAVRDAMDELGSRPSVVGPIHGDLQQYNYLFHGDEVRAIDFETLTHGYYLYDLATTRSYLGGENRDLLREALLEGYEEIRRLPPNAKRYLQRFGFLRVVDTARWILTTPGILEQGWAVDYADGAPRVAERLLETL